MKKFDSMDAYIEWTEGFENCCEYESIPCIIDDGWKISADMFIECKSYKTALRRFEKAFKEVYGNVTNWVEGMRESCENGFWAMEQHEEGRPDCFSYGVEETMEGYWYVYLNVSGIYR